MTTQKQNLGTEYVGMSTYYELEEYRDESEKPLYFLTGKVQSQDQGKPLEKLATSAPVKAVARFNKSVAQLLTTSLGIVTALQYNEALKSLLEKGGILEGVGRGGPWIIALIMTVLAYMAAVFMTSVYPQDSITEKTNPIKVESKTN